MPHIARDKQKSLVTRRHRSLLRPYRGPACTQVSYRHRERRPLPNRLCAQLEKALLSHSPDPAEENLARVSMDLFFREHPQMPPAMAGMTLKRSPSATGVSRSFKNRMSSSL